MPDAYFHELAKTVYRHCEGLLAALLDLALLELQLHLAAKLKQRLCERKNELTEVLPAVLEAEVSDSML